MTRVWYNLPCSFAADLISKRLDQIEKWRKKRQEENIKLNIGRNKTDYWFKKNEKHTRESLEKMFEKDPWAFALYSYCSERNEYEFLEKRLREILHLNQNTSVNIEFTRDYNVD
ncbi:hypothetical protein [Caulobacter phage Cr30]|uniref:hypothetical protein n=1 Tax=Caulobacter phage Cr30 TaxID=1357714 RepID=UPI0004A9BA49|nr:hypothetical protein OZ74_gp132 [Caulobacter phage Cr30]AGS81017.1 hypothetical protein [Caulobacter phage Cr30]